MISEEELQELTNCINIYANNNTNYLYLKLLDDYLYYKNRVTELELEIEDLLDRDLI